MRSGLWRDRRAGGRGEGGEVGRVCQSGGLKAPDEAGEGDVEEEEEEEEVLLDVRES